MTGVPQVTNHPIYEFSSSSQRLKFLLLTKEHLNIGKQTPLCYDTAKYNANTNFVELALKPLQGNWKSETLWKLMLNASSVEM